MVLLSYLIVISTAASASFSYPIKRQFTPNMPFTTAPGVIPATNMLALQQGMQPPSSNPIVGGNPFQTPGLAQQELSMFMQNPALQSQMSPSPPGMPDPNLQSKLQDLNGFAQLASSMGQTLQGTANTLSSTAPAWAQIFNTWMGQQPPQSAQFALNPPQQPINQMVQQQYSVPSPQPGMPSVQQPGAQFGQQQALAYGQQGPSQVATNHAAVSHMASPATGPWSYAIPQRHSLQPGRSYSTSGNTSSNGAMSSTPNTAPLGAQRKAVQPTHQPPTRFHKVKALSNRHLFKALHGQKLDEQDEDDGW